MFDSKGLYISSVMISVYYMEEVIEFLKERYIPISINEKDYSANFTDSSKKNLVTLGLYNEKYIRIIYTPYPI